MTESEKLHERFYNAAINGDVELVKSLLNDHIDEFRQNSFTLMMVRHYGTLEAAEALKSELLKIGHVKFIKS